MICEPHKIKTVRKINLTDSVERRILLRDAMLNTFNIKSDKISFDMTSQGTSARSQEQESGSLIGDETYAGSRNFEYLSKVINEIFGHEFVCPTHNILGSHKLITATMIPAGSSVLANSNDPKELVIAYKGELDNISCGKNDKYLGNIDIEEFKTKLSSKKVAYVYFNVYVCGFKPVSIEQLKEIHNLTKAANIPLVFNLSQIVEYAGFIRKQNPAYSGKTLKEISKEVALLADISVVDATQDARCNIGGLISSQKYDLYEKFMNEVVVYEGLHTYGGMAGRTMEIFARGLEEMFYEPQAEWISEQIEYFASLMPDVPKYVGADGVYIQAEKFLTGITENYAQALSAMLYVKAGVRGIVQGKYDNQRNILGLQIPRLSFTNQQLEYIASAVNELYKSAKVLTKFNTVNKPEWQDEAEFDWNCPDLNPLEIKNLGFIITTIEYIGWVSREERIRINAEVGFNTFLLPSKDIGIDLLTDSGTTAQTIEQWSSYAKSVETPASSIEYFKLVEALKEVTGYKYIIPTHQGRAAEHIMSQCLIKGGFVPGNMYFTTTKLHQEKAGGTFVDVICDEAHDSQSQFEWKGNIDIKKIQKIIDEHGAASIPYISFEFSVNLAGGQPVSMDNVREVHTYCKNHHIPVMFDATRAVENAYMIQKKDPRYKNTPIKTILRELFSYGDGCTVSSKKDYLVNIGGFLAISDDEVFYKNALSMLRVFEGTKTSGGMSAADLSVHAEGVYEMIDDTYIASRVEQTQYLGKKLLEAGIPVVEPIGTHAVFLDAKRFLPHIDQDNYPSQALASALFVESGIRAMERGNVSSGRNKKTGKNYRPALELVRLTIPRRAYTNSHMDLIAQSCINLYKKRDTIKGLKFVYEPQDLRFFQGKFEEI